MNVKSCKLPKYPLNSRNNEDVLVLNLGFKEILSMCLLESFLLIHCHLWSG